MLKYVTIGFSLRCGVSMLRIAQHHEAIRVELERARMVERGAQTSIEMLTDELPIWVIFPSRLTALNTSPLYVVKMKRSSGEIETTC